MIYKNQVGNQIDLPINNDKRVNQNKKMDEEKAQLFSIISNQYYQAIRLSTHNNSSPTSCPHSAPYSCNHTINYQ